MDHHVAYAPRDDGLVSDALSSLRAPLWGVAIQYFKKLIPCEIGMDNRPIKSIFKEPVD